jgi:hypothetical protein
MRRGESHQKQHLAVLLVACTLVHVVHGAGFNCTAKAWTYDPAASTPYPVVALLGETFSCDPATHQQFCQAFTSTKRERFCFLGVGEPVQGRYEKWPGLALDPFPSARDVAKLDDVLEDCGAVCKDENGCSKTEMLAEEEQFSKYQRWCTFVETAGEDAISSEKHSCKRCTFPLKASITTNFHDDPTIGEGGNTKFHYPSGRACSARCKAAVKVCGPNKEDSYKDDASGVAVGCKVKVVSIPSYIGLGGSTYPWYLSKDTKGTVIEVHRSEGSVSIKWEGIPDQLRNGTDSCEYYALDGTCDEPYDDCASGTDATDCTVYPSKQKWHSSFFESGYIELLDNCGRCYHRYHQEVEFPFCKFQEAEAKANSTDGAKANSTNGTALGKTCCCSLKAVVAEMCQGEIDEKKVDKAVRF